MPTIGVCIPTYNRARELRVALSSLVNQDRAVDEVLVSDNASIDDTAEVVREYAARLPLRFVRQSSNEGFDRNALAALGASRSEYRWLLGSDDQLEARALAELEPVLARRPDLVVVEARNVSADLSRDLGPARLLDAPNGAVFDCSDERQRVDFLRRARSHMAMFTFMSSLVVRGDAWERASRGTRWVGTGWNHAALAMQMLRDGARVATVAAPVVVRRTQNDSFLAERGYTRRRLLDLEFVAIAREILHPESEERAALDRWAERHFFGWRQLLAVKLQVAAVDGRKGVEQLATAYGVFERAPSHGVKLVAFRRTPAWLVGALLRARGWLRG